MISNISHHRYTGQRNKLHHEKTSVHRRASISMISLSADPPLRQTWSIDMLTARLRDVLVYPMSKQNMSPCDEWKCCVKADRRVHTQEATSQFSWTCGDQLIVETRLLLRKEIGASYELLATRCLQGHRRTIIRRSMFRFATPLQRNIGFISQSRVSL